MYIPTELPTYLPTHILLATMSSTTDILFTHATYYLQIPVCMPTFERPFENVQTALSQHPAFHLIDFL